MSSPWGWICCCCWATGWLSSAAIDRQSLLLAASLRQPQPNLRHVRQGGPSFEVSNAPAISRHCCARCRYSSERYRTTKILSNARRHGGRVAARGARAADGADAADRDVDGVSARRPRRTRERKCIPRGAGEARLARQHAAGGAVGKSGRRAVPRALRRRIGVVAAGPHRFTQHTQCGGFVATNAHDPDHLRADCRSGSHWIGSKLPATGGNATGFTVVEGSMAGKWVELLKEIAPRVTRAAILFNPATAPYSEIFLDPFRTAGSSLGVEVT